MTDGPHGARVPRAVAGVPPPALADGEAVAKAWLLELLAAAPLTRAAAVPVAELAARGPALCAALLAAIGSDSELERLEPGGDRGALAAGAGALSGAADAAAAAAAVAALRRGVWAALRAELAHLDAAATAALAERVAHVADVATAAALAPPGVSPPLRDTGAPGATEADADGTPPLPDARSPQARGRAADAGEAPLEVDLAGAEEPWRQAVERALAAHGRDGSPFAVLAVEAADAERLLAAGGADAAALVAFERGVCAAVRPGDVVVRERAGRVWIVAPGLVADAARALAQRVAEAASGTAAPHGVPLAASAGVAVCPADGADAARLAARVDERLFGARAAGRPLGGSGGPGWGRRARGSPRGSTSGCSPLAPPACRWCDRAIAPGAARRTTARAKRRRAVTARYGAGATPPVPGIGGGAASGGSIVAPRCGETPIVSVCVRPSACAAANVRS